MRINISIATLAAAALLAASCSDVSSPLNIEPRLTADGADGITRTEATVTGHITIDSEAEMPILRFIYGTTETSETSTDIVTSAADGSVAARLSELSPGTQYFFRLQGSNGSAVIESNTEEFTTMPNDKPTVSRPEILGQGAMSVIVKYAITDDGGEDITSTGCYAAKAGGSSQIKAEATGVNAGKDIIKLYIDGLEKNSTYEIRAFAANSEGESTGDAVSLTTRDAVIQTEPGSLELLMGDSWSEMTTLSVAGPLNGDDLRCLRKLAGRDADGSATDGSLTTLDMTDARIVAGGGPYDSSRYTKDGVIGYSLFAGCTQLTAIILPESATVIEKDAIKNCSSLQTLEIPMAAASVEPSSGCTRLESVTVSPANTSYSSVDGVLLSADSSEIVWFSTGKTGSYTLPSTVTTIGDYAFSGCSITEFILPAGITSIGRAAFSNSLVERAVMPAGFRLVPSATFQQCTRLTEVSLGEATEYIGEYAFDGCPLKHIYIDALYPPVCAEDALSSSFGDLFQECVLHVPEGRVGFYKADSVWGKFKNIVSKEDV